MYNKIHNICNEALVGSHHKNVTDLMCELRYTVQRIQKMTEVDNPTLLAFVFETELNELKGRFPLDSPERRTHWRALVSITKEVMYDLQNELDADQAKSGTPRD